MGVGTAVLDGEDRNAESAVTWGSVKEETSACSCICRRARIREEVWCETPWKEVKAT